MRSWLLPCSAWLASALVSTVSQAELASRAAPDEGFGPLDYPVVSERRSGFAASVGFGYGLSAARGYPNEPEKIDNPDFESEIDPSFGAINTLWIGGAPRDWLVLGMGIWGLSGSEEDLKGTGGGFLIHVEPFPLWSLGGRFRDLALYANLGAGSHSIKGGPEKTDGGLMSLISVGTAFELFRFGHFALGPTLEGTFLYSLSARVGGGFAGLRGTFYGGP